MRIGRFITCVAGAVALLGAVATAAEPAEIPLDLETSGKASCNATLCFMMRVVSTGRPGGEINIVTVFGRSRLQPIGLSIEIPATADQQSGIKYGFANTDGKIVRKPWGKEFTAPIAVCDKDVCSVRIEDDITLEGHNMQKDILENTAKYDAFVVAFQSGGKELAAAVSTGFFKNDHELMLAESRKTEQGQGAGRRQMADWDIKCDTFCSMVHFLDAERRGDQVAVALRFDRTTGKANSMIVQVPPNVDREKGAQIIFFDPRDAATQRKPEGFSMSFAECDQTSCIARAASDPTNPDRDIQVHVVENILSYSMIGVGYLLKGEQVTVGESTDSFKPAYQRVLAELKKPQ